MYYRKQPRLGAISVTDSAKLLSTLFNATTTPIPVTEDIPEVVVATKRIPWWQWMLGGATLIVAANLLRSK